MQNEQIYKNYEYLFEKLCKKAYYVKKHTINLYLRIAKMT